MMLQVNVVVAVAVDFAVVLLKITFVVVGGGSCGCC
jgi:hypothetical protein